jgi:hypothetical protein
MPTSDRLLPVRAGQHGPGRCAGRHKYELIDDVASPEPDELHAHFPVACG